jgi:hypothetical protein
MIEDSIPKITRASVTATPATGTRNSPGNPSMATTAPAAR